MVSVIIPTYNREKTISKSVLSVANQSVRNIEVLVIDDGSTDATGEVIRTLSAEDPRIKYYKQENGGANKARNLGIRLAAGKYVAFNDSDDIWRQDKIKKELEILQNRREYRGVFSKFELHYVNENRSLVRPKRVEKPLYHQLMVANVVNTPNFIIEKKVIQEMGGFNEELRRFQDWELATKISQRYSLFFLDEILTDTYQFGSGHLSNNITAAYESYHLIEREFEEDRNRNPRVKRDFYFYRAMFFYGTEEFKSSLFGSLKKCNYNLILIAKLSLKYMQLLAQRRKK